MLFKRPLSGSAHQVFRWSVLILVLLVFPLSVQSAVEEWSSSGPSGGSTSPIVVDPVNPSNVYAGSFGAGVFKSVDGGLTWVPKNWGLESLSVDSMAIDPSDPNRLFAGTFGAGVFVSTNGAETWKSANVGLDSDFIETIVFDGSDPGTVYVGTTDMGVRKSTDGGATWSPSSSGLPTGIGVASIAIDPTDPTVLFAGTTLAPPFDFFGVYKSTDAGASWIQSNNGIPEDWIYAVAIDPDTPTTLYAGTGNVSGAGGGVYKTVDSGASWSFMSSGIPAGIAITSLLIDPNAPSTVYAGAGPVYKTVDGGASWTESGSGMDALAFALETIAIDPQDSSKLFVGTLRFGIYRSEDAGGSWLASNTGINALSFDYLVVDPQTPTTLFAAATSMNVMVSVDGGATWADAGSEVRGLFVRDLEIDPSDGQVLYASVFGGIFKSIDGGASWFESDAGILGFSVDDVAVDPSDSDTAYACSSTLYKSIDAGANWSESASGFVGSCRTVVVDPLNSDVVYSGSLFGGLYRSLDGGANWATLNNGLPGGADVSIVKVHPTDTQIIYLGVLGAGIYKTTDGGSIWSPLAGDVVPLFPLDIEIAPSDPDTVFVASLEGVVRSGDAGATWSDVSRGSVGGARSIVVDPSNAELAMAGMAAGGFASRERFCINLEAPFPPAPGSGSVSIGRSVQIDGASSAELECPAISDELAGLGRWRCHQRRFSVSTSLRRRWRLRGRDIGHGCRWF